MLCFHKIVLQSKLLKLLLIAQQIKTLTAKVMLFSKNQIILRKLIKFLDQIQLNNLDNPHFLEKEKLTNKKIACCTAFKWWVSLTSALEIPFLIIILKLCRIFSGNKMHNKSLTVFQDKWIVEYLRNKLKKTHQNNKWANLIQNKS